MQARSHRTGLRSVIAIAVMVAFVLSTLGLTISRHSLDAALSEAAHHGSFSVAHADHDHDHDDDDDKDDDSKKSDVVDAGLKALGHSHSQNGGDHSHVTPGTPPTIASLGFKLACAWQAVPGRFTDIKTHFKLDRPPKLSFFA